MASFKREEIIPPRTTEPYYENSKQEIKAIVKETILELLENEEFIQFLKTKLKSDL